MLHNRRAQRDARRSTKQHDVKRMAVAYLPRTRVTSAFMGVSGHSIFAVPGMERERLRLSLTPTRHRFSTCMSEPVGPVQRPILNRFRDVRSANRASPLQISYCASYLENAIVRPCRKALSLHDLL